MSLSCQNISYKINDKNILEDVKFSLNTSEHLLILGPSGSGKTTLLCIMAGLLKPNKGQVKFNGDDIYKLSSTDLDNFRGQNLGIIFQNFHLIKSLTVYQNIAIAAKFSGTEINKEKIHHLLNEVGLLEKANDKVTTLSYVQAQRIALIRSCVNKPKWIFCDEPTSALDDINTEKLLTLLKNEAKQNKSSLIIVTHDQRVKNHFDKNHILTL